MRRSLGRASGSIEGVNRAGVSRTCVAKCLDTTRGTVAKMYPAMYQ